MSKISKLDIENAIISVTKIEEEDYICLTDMAKAKDDDNRAADVIKNWIRTRTTIEFLGTWEMMYNPNFKVTEFDHFKMEAGLPTFVLSPKQWAEKTGAVGVISKSGRYGGTYAHRDIVFDIYVSLAHIRSLGEISPEYLLYFINSPVAKSQFNKRLKEVGVPNLHLQEIREVEITYPKSIPEQKQIVTILDKAFAAIDQAKANIERNIENAKELFQSKKEFLFDALSKECKVLPIESVCNQIFAGGDAPKENFSKQKTEGFNVPIIANAFKDNGLYGYTNEARVIKPSITVAARGSGTGHTEFRNYPFVPIVRLIVLTPDTSIVNAEFLMHAIKNLIIERSGSAIPQLTVPMMKSYSIPVPDINKQTDVNKSLNNIELLLVEYKSKLEEKLNYLEELKKSILQKAFTGELTEKEVAV